MAGPVTLFGLGNTLTGNDIARAINNLGVIAGTSASLPSSVYWPAGTTTALHIDGPRAEGRDINLYGQVAGEYAPSGPPQAALWTPQSGGVYTRTDISTQLPTPILSVAYGINNFGQVVGSYRVLASPPASGIVDKCFLWTPSGVNGTSGTVTFLDGLSDGSCVANDVNSDGQVVGASVAASGATHAFVWTPSSTHGTSGITTDLSASDFSGYGAAINDAGQVAGQRYVGGGGAKDAAVWTPNGLGGYDAQDLGVFTGDETFAMDINDAGFVVGWARRNTLIPVEDDGFFWQNGQFTLLPGPTTITTPGALTNLSGSLVRVVGSSLLAGSSPPFRTALRWDVTVSEVLPQGCLERLVERVKQLRADGFLNAGEERSFLAKLDAVARQIGEGKKIPARNLLYAFINEVNALVNAGRLTTDQAQPLIDDALCVIASL